MILTGGGAGFGGEAGNVGIGFAVPSNMAKQVLDQLVKNGKVTRGYMGVSLQAVTRELAPQFGLKNDHGAIVADVTPGKPGDQAGLKTGDVIVKINGEEVQDSNDLTMKVTGHAPGDTVTLDVIRDGKPMTIKVTLAQRPNGLDWAKSGGNSGGNDNGDNGNGAADNGNARGINVENLSPDVVQQLGLDSNTKGVVVTSVDPDSTAADAGIGRGTVIVAVERHPVANVSDFKRLMAQAQNQPVLLTVNAGGNTGFVVVQPK